MEFPLAVLVGNADRPEFQQPLAAVAERMRIAPFAAPSQAADWLHAQRETPELIIVAQSRPGDFSAEDLQFLQRHWPLSRIVELLGSWCEGEPRTGQPRDGALRTYWHQWRPRFVAAAQCRAAGRAGLWDQPAASQPEDWLLDGHDGERETERYYAEGKIRIPARRDFASAQEWERGLVGVQSQTREMRAWLVAACRTFGWQAVAIEDQGPLANDLCGVILDFTPQPPTPDRIAATVANAGGAPLIVLASYPRWEDVQAAHQAGAATVISLPLQLGDLEFELQRICWRGN